MAIQPIFKPDLKKILITIVLSVITGLYFFNNMDVTCIEGLQDCDAVFKNAIMALIIFTLMLAFVWYTIVSFTIFFISRKIS